MALHSRDAVTVSAVVVTRRLQQYGRPYQPKHSPSTDCSKSLHLNKILSSFENNCLWLIWFADIRGGHSLIQVNCLLEVWHTIYFFLSNVLSLFAVCIGMLRPHILVQPFPIRIVTLHILWCCASLCSPVTFISLSTTSLQLSFGLSIYTHFRPRICTAAICRRALPTGRNASWMKQ